MLINHKITEWGNGFTNKAKVCLKLQKNFLITDSDLIYRNGLKWRPVAR